MSVRQIVEHAGERLPTRSKTPDTVVARDLSMDLKKKGEDSIFIRTAPGRYTLREIHLHNLESQTEQEGLARREQSGPEQELARQELARQELARQEFARQEFARQRARETVHMPEAMVAEAQATSILSSALREERAGLLPARAPAVAEDEQRTG
jgi:hypothetical protein